MKKALITGISGQDGSFLAEFLLNKNYQVFGLIRRNSVEKYDRIEHLKDKIKLCYGDLTDFASIIKIIKDIVPDEIYNLAAQSHVQVSFDIPEYTTNVDAIGILRIVEAVRILNLEKVVKIYQASTSELFGKVVESPQSETTPFCPYSPYAIAKQYAYWICKEYREAYNMFICNGILFNHESERRGESFVTRKITLSVSRIFYGLQECLYLGNLNSLRDWGYAKDYVECMWLMLQSSYPDDYVVATGIQHTVREFVTLAFRYVDIDIKWTGEGVEEIGINKKNDKIVVRVSKDYYRPTDVDNLLGNPQKAKEQLGWNPQKTTYEELVRTMMDYDLNLVKNEIEKERR